MEIKKGFGVQMSCEETGSTEVERFSTKFTSRIIFGAVVAASVVGGIAWKICDIGEKQDEKSRKEFASATLEQQFNSVRRGIVSIECIDAATAVKFAPKEINTPQDLRTFYDDGCKPRMASASGNKNIDLTPAVR